MDEGDERIAAAFSSRYVDELQGLFHDLPAPVPAGPPVPGWRALGEGLVAQVRYELQTTTAGGIRSRRFLTTAAAAIILIALVVAMIGAVVHGIADPGMHDHFHDGFDGPGNP
jgi:hypothetical protein